MGKVTRELLLICTSPEVASSTEPGFSRNHQYVRSMADLWICEFSVTYSGGEQVFPDSEPEPMDTYQTALEYRMSHEDFSNDKPRTSPFCYPLLGVLSRT